MDVNHSKLNNMKQLLILATLIFSLSGFAQTPLIAHKSHAGTRMTFFIDPNSNFGKIMHEPRLEQPVFPEYNESFQPVNDTTVVKLTTDDNNMLLRVDTISKKKYETIEEVKQKHSTYPNRIQNRSRYMEGGTRKSEIIVSTPPRNTNTPSFLLIFALVSAVGMFLYRILFSRETVQLKA